jgi:IMP dehydrogenase/GMP reductase
MITDINSRSECTLRDGTDKLNIFTAPMSTVVSLENMDIFNENGIIPILPRNIDYDIRLQWLTNKEPKYNYGVAFSLTEINDLFDYYVDNNLIKNNIFICIDIANGHMKSLYEKVKRLKSISRNIKIMIGNIANPETYEIACLAGVDYCRVGIGSGTMCLTSSNTGIHVPLASLIWDMADIKENFLRKDEFATKIVADGGIKNYSDVIKYHYIGADYVMIGTIFAQCDESPGEITIIDGIFPKYKSKMIYGMASKRGQIDLFKGKNKSDDEISSYKTAEGKEEMLEIKYNIPGWTQNMRDYLKSAMSYTGIRRLEDFIGDKKLVRFLTPYAAIGFNK